MQGFVHQPYYNKQVAMELRRLLPLVYSFVPKVMLYTRWNMRLGLNKGFGVQSVVVL